MFSTKKTNNGVVIVEGEGREEVEEGVGKINGDGKNIKLNKI